MEKTKIILDTDIGSDIDDAVCLAYLLAQPRCELLGVTTVTGAVNERASMADALGKVAGREILIYPGAVDPMLVPIRQPKVPQAASLARWPHRTDFPQGQAVEFLRQTIRKYPHEVTLLAIGPLTNLAALFLADMQCASLLKELVLMGGNFTPVHWGHGNLCEWNILNDPHAAEIVMRAPIPRVRAIGLDVTTKVQMNAQQTKAKFTHKLLAPVLDFASHWFGPETGVQNKITFHDPLAATIIFDESICEFEAGKIEVDISGGPMSGFTLFHNGAEPRRHHVATTVSPEKFFDAYFGVFRRRSREEIQF